MMNVDPRVLSRLEASNQTHVLRFWDELSPDRQARLHQQLALLDFDLLDTLVRENDPGEDWSQLSARAQPPAAIELKQAHESITPQQARERGEEALRSGELAVVLVAGGQGTRLGFEHPKGMLPLGPVSGRTLFQILIDATIARARRYHVTIPLYVMTSPATDLETAEYLQRNDRFGLAQEDLRLFCQGTMPAIDADTGQLLLAEKDSLFLSPDGHGGMLQAFDRHGCLQHARQRGIRYLFYGQIDNPLLQVCDPTFIGYHLLSQSQMTTQVIRKVDPLERVGNFVSVDGQTRIIEYSDLPEEAAQRRTADGSLSLWAGSIAVHLIDLEFIESAVQQTDALPFHRALKSVPHLDAQGRRVEPTAPNAIKFERFIFDLLPRARNALAVEVATEDAFAPVKNAAGHPTDTLATAQAAMLDLHHRWLKQAGIHLDDKLPIEISPSFALDPQELSDRIQLDFSVDQPTYLSDTST